MAASKSSSKDSGEAEVQAKMDAINGKGFHGVRVDPTPLENYTVAGVVAGKPTPETDAKAAEAAAKATGTAPQVGG